MTLNSIHEDATHRSQIIDGDYFGPDGAIATARKQVKAAQQKCEEPMKIGYEKNTKALLREVLGLKIMLLSTLFSALSHAAAQVKAKRWNNKFWYAYQAFLLLRNIEDLVQEVVESESDMTPGERDVLIAGLQVSYLVGCAHFNFWYRREAARLIRYQVRHLPTYHASSLFAKARALSMKGHFSHSQRSEWASQIDEAIYCQAPETDMADLEFPLSWMDIARLARFVGDADRQHHAAMMSASKDVQLKAGITC
jgi:hypothetical protein